jgi:hypothetical protein
MFLQSLACKNYFLVHWFKICFLWFKTKMLVILFFLNFFLPAFLFVHCEFPHWNYANFARYPPINPNIFCDTFLVHNPIWVSIFILRKWEESRWGKTTLGDLQRTQEKLRQIRGKMEVCAHSVAVKYNTPSYEFTFNVGIDLISKLLILTVRHGYPWVPTDQAHGRPRQSGSDLLEDLPTCQWAQPT